MQVLSIDHVGLPVRDVEAALAFYADVLGLEVVNLEDYRSGRRPFVAVRAGDALIDLLPAPDHVPPPRGRKNDFAHLCLTVPAEAWASLLERLRAREIEIFKGPVRRWGAQGMGTSIYVYDPDNAQIELKYYA